ncbi:MAG: hypothetical protein JSU04_10105 [Bdellovibrionales bacterium]|nr:hypothetical protein [Bdellovibrionales bacterium]
MRNIASLFILVAAVLSFNSAQAFVSPVSVSVIPPVQFPPNDFTVTGVRASVGWGQHRNMYGIDLGLLGNITEQDFTGIAVSGIFNNTRGTTNIIGLQFAGITNINTNKTRVIGLQAALGANYQAAASTVAGVQLALLANVAPFTDIYGLQLGLYNRAKEVYGFQIGLVNIADNLHGIQIGLANFNHKGPFAISPIINVGF